MESINKKVKIVGNWELSWNSPIKEVEQWNLLLSDFNISDWYMWPISGVRNNQRNMVNLIEKEKFEDILQENLDKTWVFFEPKNPRTGEMGVSLEEFKHPEDVLYIFGSAHFNPVLGYKREKDIVVTIPTINNIGGLWPHQCLAICLYDRMVKSWQ